MRDEEHRPRLEDLFLTRRQLLNRFGMGMGTIGLASTLADAGLLSPVAHAMEDSSPVSRQPHFAARAKRVIHIFPQGGPSQMDTFDPKPALLKYNGQPVAKVLPDYLKNVPESIKEDGLLEHRLSGNLYGSPFKFAKHGQCQAEVSELFPHLARHVDELCIVRAMYTTSSVHEVAMILMNTGDGLLVRPSMGSWVTYGLGATNRNLPAFIALSPTGVPSGDKPISNAFLPGVCRGTSILTNNPKVDKMIEHIRSTTTSRREQRRQLGLLQVLNRRHLAERQRDAFLESRISAFETAFHMQTEAADVFDLSKEPEYIRTLYGDTEQGRQLLLARRLVERDVRFVQVWHKSNKSWDTHDENNKGQKERAKECDQPLAALIADLKQRGMLDDTLVLWAGEFGRTPTSDVNDIKNKKGIGRDHNANGFTIWMAGGGLKRGLVYGKTDDFGAIGIEDKMSVHDLHATILHLLGFDHTKLTYRYAGRDFRLTDVYGNVVQELLA